MNEEMNHLFATRQFEQLLEQARTEFQQGNLTAFDLWLLNLICGNKAEAEVIAKEGVELDPFFLKPESNFLFRNQNYIHNSSQVLAEEIFSEWDQE